MSQHASRGAVQKCLCRLDCEHIAARQVPGVARLVESYRLFSMPRIITEFALPVLLLGLKFSSLQFVSPERSPQSPALPVSLAARLTCPSTAGLIFEYSANIRKCQSPAWVLGKPSSASARSQRPPSMESSALTPLIGLPELMRQPGDVLRPLSMSASTRLDNGCPPSFFLFSSLLYIVVTSDGNIRPKGRRIRES